MGVWTWLIHGRGHTAEQLAQRAGLPLAELQQVPRTYQDDSPAVHHVIRSAKAIAADFGYRIHHGRKLRIRRRHQQQRVTGLVVNTAPRVDRQTRRRLRAVIHHLREGRPASLDPGQLAGWAAYLKMIERQRD